MPLPQELLSVVNATVAPAAPSFPAIYPASGSCPGWVPGSSFAQAEELPPASFSMDKVKLFQRCLKAAEK